MPAQITELLYLKQQNKDLSNNGYSLYVVWIGEWLIDRLLFYLLDLVCIKNR